MQPRSMAPQATEHMQLAHDGSSQTYLCLPPLRRTHLVVTLSNLHTSSLPVVCSVCVGSQARSRASICRTIYTGVRALCDCRLHSPWDIRLPDTKKETRSTARFAIPWVGVEAPSASAEGWMFTTTAQAEDVPTYCNVKISGGGWSWDDTHIWDGHVMRVLEGGLHKIRSVCHMACSFRLLRYCAALDSVCLIWTHGACRS